MSTRFWLTSSAPPYTPTTKRGAWDVASGEDVQYLGRKPAGSAGTSTINVGSTAADRDVLLHRSISDGAVKAGTLAGTVTWVIGAKESNAALNGFFHLHIYVTSGDTDTPRGTLLTDSIGATEFGTTAIGAGEGAKSLSSVSVQVGDRIVVEIGYRANASGTTQNATINYGNTGTTDLSISSASVTSQPGWIEFSGADGLWTKSLSTLTDSFPSSIDSKWTASAGVSATGGRARINCTTAVPNMFTASSYEIAASTLAFKVPTLPVTGGGSTVTFSGYLMPGSGSNTNLEFEYSPNSGNLVLRNNVSGSDASPTTLTYSSTDHLWWRFKDNGSGSVLMETSPDNTTWTTRRTVAMSQWMLQGNVVPYFEAGRASGTADFAEIDDINPAGITQAVTLASSTETAQALAKTKTLASTLASSTETAQAITRTKRLSLGIASETDTGQTVGHTRQRAVGTASATETAQALGRAKTKALALASETGTAQVVAPGKSATVGPATDSSAAQQVGAAKRKTVTAALGADAAQPISAAKRAGLPVASETGTARLLTPSKARALGVAIEQDAGQTIGGSTSHAVTPAQETGAAQAIHAVKTRALSPAQETASAQTVTSGQAHPVDLAAAVDTAQPVHAGKTKALGTAFDYGTAMPAGRTKTVQLGYATETATAQAAPAVRRLALGPATETGTTCPITPTKRQLITAATETDTATAITTPAAGETHGLRLTGGPHPTWTSPQPPVSPWAAHTTDTAWTCTRDEVPVNSLSTEFHEVGVTWTRGDPTTHTVQMAVIPHGHDPDDADWHTAVWDTDADGLPVAKLLVGPDGGAVEPAPGRYRDWVSIDAPPEHPVLATPPYDIS